MADRLELSDVEALCRIGVTDEERATPQKLWFDLAFPIDARAVAKTDRIGDALDYAAIVEEARAYCRLRNFHLLETVAEGLAFRLLELTSAAWVHVRAKKRALPGVGYAAVDVLRRRPALRRRAGRS